MEFWLSIARTHIHLYPDNSIMDIITISIYSLLSINKYIGMEQIIDFNAFSLSLYIFHFIDIIDWLLLDQLIRMHSTHYRKIITKNLIYFLFEKQEEFDHFEYESTLECGYRLCRNCSWILKLQRSYELQVSFS